MTAPGTPQTARRNPIALISLVAGVLAIVGTFGNQVIPALVLGVVAVGAAPYALGRRHEGRGRAQAIIGLILGAVPLLFLLFVAVRNG